MNIVFQSPQDIAADAYVVAVADGGTFSPAADALDKATGGAARQAVDTSRFSGKSQEHLDLMALSGAPAVRAVLAGIGKPADASPKAWQDWGGKLYAHLANSGAASVAVAVETMGGAVAEAGDQGHVVTLHCTTGKAARQPRRVPMAASSLNSIRKSAPPFR